MILDQFMLIYVLMEILVMIIRYLQSTNQGLLSFISKVLKNFTQNKTLCFYSQILFISIKQTLHSTILSLFQNHPKFHSCNLMTFRLALTKFFQREFFHLYSIKEFFPRTHFDFKDNTISLFDQLQSILFFLGIFLNSIRSPFLNHVISLTNKAFSCSVQSIQNLIHNLMIIFSQVFR